jgi:hypothetical protein
VMSTSEVLLRDDENMGCSREGYDEGRRFRLERGEEDKSMNMLPKADEVDVSLRRG